MPALEFWREGGQPHPASAMAPQASPATAKRRSSFLDAMKALLPTKKRNMAASPARRRASTKVVRPPAPAQTSSPTVVRRRRASDPGATTPSNRRPSSAGAAARGLRRLFKILDRLLLAHGGQTARRTGFLGLWKRRRRPSASAEPSDVGAARVSLYFVTRRRRGLWSVGYVSTSYHCGGGASRVKR